MSTIATVAHREATTPRQAWLLKAANAVLILTVVGCIAASGFAIAARKPLYLRAAPAVIALGCLALLAVRPVARITIVAMAIGAWAGLYATEIASRVLYNPDLPYEQEVRKAALARGAPYDPRTRLEAILDYRSQQVNAYPPFYPYQLVDTPLMVDGRATIPLGGHSNVFVVACNEGGQYLTYTTDEHGFPNPRGLWSKTPMDVAIIGDSNAVGECVPQADGVANQLRTHFPATVTLGAGGHGPLFELATIREYLHEAKPKHVLWIYSESHTPQYLDFESHHPFLLRYLDSNFTQDLISKQPALDAAIKQYTEEGLRRERHANGWAATAHDVAILKNVRLLLYDLRQRLHPPKPVEFNTELFERALHQGKQEVESWGGEVTLVYWPDASRYPGIASYSPALRQRHDERHRMVLELANKLGINVIDVTPAFPDLPASRAAENAKYFYSFPAHYTPEGYRVAGKTILSALRTQH